MTDCVHRNIEAATRLSEGGTRRLAGRDSDPPLVVRVGINTGEPVTQDADLFGAAVNPAARLCERAEAGAIPASDAVRSDATEEGFWFGEPQPVELKGFTKPVVACSVLWGAPDRPRSSATAS